MYRRNETTAFEALLSAQSSVISNEQAFLAGHTRQSWSRLRNSGAWQQLDSGIYLLGREKPTFEQLLWAGHLAGGDDSAIGGRAALVRWGISTRVPGVIDLWLPNGVKRVARGPWHYRQDRAGRLARRRGTLPLIRPEDALLDVAEGEPLEHFVALVADALRVRKVSTPSLVRSIRSRARLRDRRLWLDTLGDLAGIESTLEFVYRRDVERAHGLPAGRRQASLVTSTRVDVWYDEFCTLIELDGRVGHVDGAFRDLDRDNAHAVLAQASLRYGSADVRGEPCAVAAQVAAVLRSRGWAGELTRCRHCPPTAAMCC